MMQPMKLYQARTVIPSQPYNVFRLPSASWHNSIELIFVGSHAHDSPFFNLSTELQGSHGKNEMIW